jgi:hypothetical protein
MNGNKTSQETELMSAEHNGQMNEAQAGMAVNTMVAEGARITFQPSKRKTIRKINILIERDFSIKTAKSVYDKINEETASYDYLDVALKNLSQFDLAAVQMLQYLRKTGATANKNITVDAELSTEDRALMQNAGLMEFLIKTKLSDNN